MMAVSEMIHFIDCNLVFVRHSCVVKGQKKDNLATQSVPISSVYPEFKNDVANQTLAICVYFN